MPNIFSREELEKLLNGEPPPATEVEKHTIDSVEDGEAQPVEEVTEESEQLDEANTKITNLKDSDTPRIADLKKRYPGATGFHHRGDGKAFDSTGTFMGGAIHFKHKGDDMVHYTKGKGLTVNQSASTRKFSKNVSKALKDSAAAESHDEQLDEAKRPAHWHSHQLDNIEDMIASVGHTPHPTKFMANPSDADLAGHYEKEADKHGKLAQLNDTACFHAENSGRDYSCDKHKSMAEINIMKSDLYKTLAGLYQMSHNIEK